MYERGDNGFALYSLGADGQEGGEGLNADIRLADI
ncbi:MAG: type II secretion system protein GspG [Pseudomonadales bacterium]|nr:type II secretion system protein GspG [Pseudomonadales bacterium]